MYASASSSSSRLHVAARMDRIWWGKEEARGHANEWRRRRVKKKKRGSDERERKVCYMST